MRLHGIESYMNLGRFYARHPGALRSREIDYGVWWKGPTGDNWRVTYVVDTGHVYAIRLGTTSVGTLDLGLQEELELTVVSAGRGGGPVIILGTVEPDDEEELERILAGWAEECGRAGSLVWCYRRLQEAS